MLVGTFNLVMAERLVRKVCDHCKIQVSVKDNPKYKFAKESFRNFEKEALKKEIMINLERDGVFKIIKGMTTLDEVYRYVKARFDK